MTDLAAGLSALGPHEAAIRRFVEDHLLDECGLVRSHVNADTLCPWTAEQLQDWDTLPIYRKERGDPAGQLAYEDSLMATGEYASSQIARFHVTGDPSALAAAAHPTYALLRVLYEGERYEPGFLPKPHGGMRRAAYSHEISPDQYIKSYVALRAYQPFAPPSLARTIDRYLVAIADYFLNRDFQHPYRERTLVNPQTRPHCISIYIPSLWIAGKITGAPRYHEALRAFDEAIEGILRGEGEVNYNLCSLYVEGFHLALSEGLEDERLCRAMRIQWERNLELVREDGHGYQGPTVPVRTSRVLRMASLGPLVHQHCPDAQAMPVALRVLRAQTDPRRMCYFLEDDPHHIARGHAYLARSICETSVTSWLLGYWRMRGLPED